MKFLLLQRPTPREPAAELRRPAAPVLHLRVIAMSEDDARNEAGEDDPANLQPQPMAGHIRRRPGMYIGDSGPTGLHSLADELVEYGLAEVSSGHGKSIHVRINADGSLSVADDGRGIPVEIHAKAKMTTLEWVMTFSTGVEIHGGKRVFMTSLHGTGARVVTALSDWSEAIVCCDGRVYRQRYERGLSAGDVCDTGPAGTQTGTKITFHPDPEIFPNATFDRGRLEAHLRELAFLNKGLITKLTEERTGREEHFHYPGGVAEFVEYLNRAAEVLHKPVYIHKAIDDVQVEIAMQYTTGEEGRIRCYANNAYNHVGGTHQRGFRSALTHALNRYGHKESLLPSGLVPTGEDFREGLTAIVSVKISEPLFESQRKLRLNNPEVEGIVANVVRKEINKFLKENPEEARRIVMKAVAAARARKAKNSSKDRESGGPPK
jgi:DNA gyrase subunit B